MGGNNKGYFGEQEMGFFLGQNGFFFIDGPSGAAGHKANAKGFDGIAYSPKTDTLIIYDNKAYSSSGNVSSSSALEQNLLKNLDAKIRQVQEMKTIPFKSRILNKLEALKQSILSQKPFPAKVTLAVSNAGGFSSGITDKLRLKGIKFVDVNSTFSSGNRTKIYGRAFVLALGLLSSILDILSDWGIQRRIEKEIRELSTRIYEIQLLGEGVLIIIEVIEWERHDSNGNRAKMFNAIYIQGGNDYKDAFNRYYHPTMSGFKQDYPPPKGWRKRPHILHWVEPLALLQ